MSRSLLESPDLAPSDVDVPGASCRLDVSGMDCADCAKTIEVSLAAMPGVETATVSFARGTADVVYDGKRIDPNQLASRVKALGYETTAPSTQNALVFDVSGMDCADCAKTIEKTVARLPGVAAAVVNFGTATLTVTPAGPALTEQPILAAVGQLGYAARPRSEQVATPATAWWRRRRVLETGIAVLLWGAAFAIERGGAPRPVTAPLFLLAMVVAGYPVARAGWYAAKARRADMNLLMTVAAVGAVAIGEWDEGSSVLILFAVGVTLQTLTVDRTRRAIQALVRLAPAEATVKRSGGEERVPVADVEIGETVLVRPGERVPVDGLVLAGHSAVDQASITGESIPVEVGPDASVFAGSINGDGVLEIRSTKRASDTTLARIVHLVEEAQSSKAPAQAFVDRFAAVYTPLVVVAALLIATAVPLFAGDFRGWIFKALILLVVACPCALVISTPVALVAAIGSASRRGVLFKGGAAIEALAAVRSVALDKTGTLTVGRPAVTHVLTTGSLTPEEVLARAAGVDRRSTHPVALGIVRSARERGVAIPEATAAENLPGRGARAELAGVIVLVGSRRLFPALTALVEETLAELEAQGKTTILVGTEEGVDGVIAVSDPLRPTARTTVDALRALGLNTVMLTGDNPATAGRVASGVGIADVRAGLLPEDKVAAVTELQRTSPVAMVGDGVNDAPALATADVGVAMGAAGSDVAIEAADVALMGDELAQLPVAVRLARRTLATIRENIAASLVVKAIFLVLTLLGATNLWLAVLADMGMSLLVTANSLRLLRGPRSRTAPVPRHGSPPEPLLQASHGD